MAAIRGFQGPWPGQRSLCHTCCKSQSWQVAEPGQALTVTPLELVPSEPGSPCWEAKGIS